MEDAMKKNMMRQRARFRDDVVCTQESVIDHRSVSEVLFKEVCRGLKKHDEYVRAGSVSMTEAISAVESYDAKHYLPNSGTVVECLDNSGYWRPAVVTNSTIKHNDEGIHDDVIAITAVSQSSKRMGMLSHGHDPSRVRPLEAAIRARWGEQPVYWMQYQLLQAEQQMQFERHHCFDFEEIKWSEWIEKRFRHWTASATTQEGSRGKRKGGGGDDTFGVKDSHNNAFQAYYSKQSRGAKEALLAWVSEPFIKFDDIIENWFDGFDTPISCYTYLSFLGQDWCTSALLSLTAYFATTYSIEPFCPLLAFPFLQTTACWHWPYSYSYRLFSGPTPSTTWRSASSAIRTTTTTSTKTAPPTPLASSTTTRRYFARAGITPCWGAP